MEDIKDIRLNLEQAIKQRAIALEEARRAASRANELQQDIDMLSKALDVLAMFDNKPAMPEQVYNGPMAAYR